MTQNIDRVKSLLPVYRQNRLRACGAPMPTMVRDDGSVIDGATYRCGDRFCAYCARCRAQRVYACILRAVTPTLGGAARGVMVTLTHQKPPGLSAADLVAARELQATIQRTTHRILRRHRETRYSLPIPDLSSINSGKYIQITEPGGVFAIPAGGRDTYIWAREVTAGGDTRYEGWHCHVHYLVPSKIDAERLIAAHMLACESLDVRATWQNQHVSEPRRAEWRGGDTPDIRDAAQYITHYVTKSELPTEDVLEAYIVGMRGARQYDAGGAWRPIGVGKRRDPIAPRVVAVRERVRCVTADGEIVERSLERDFADYMRQKTPWWQGLTLERTLNQYKTKFWEQNTNWLPPVSVVDLAISSGSWWRSPRDSVDIEPEIDMWGGDDGANWVEC